MFKLMSWLFTDEHVHTSDPYVPKDGEKSVMVRAYANECVQCSVLRVRKLLAKKKTCECNCEHKKS